MPNNNDLKILERLVADGLANIIGKLQGHLEGGAENEVKAILNRLTYRGRGVKRVLPAALRIKKIVGQIDTIIHVYGMLAVLPGILRKGEKIESLSLGADNAGSNYDLKTNFRLAEFKFSRWTGQDAARKKSLFKDLCNLADGIQEIEEKDKGKEKYLYVLDKDRVINFLNGHATINSLVSKNRTLEERFREKYKNQFETMTISEYYNKHKDKIKIISLSTENSEEGISANIASFFATFLEN